MSHPLPFRILVPTIIQLITRQVAPFFISRPILYIHHQLSEANQRNPALQQANLLLRKHLKDPGQLLQHRHTSQPQPLLSTLQIFL